MYNDNTPQNYPSRPPNRSHPNSYSSHPRSNQTYYTPNQQDSLSPQHSQLPPPPSEYTYLHGIVIGHTRDRSGDYLFYSCALKTGIIVICCSVQELFVGQWIGINVFSANYQGEFKLNHSNSSGYGFTDDLPNPRFCASKCITDKVTNEGELVVVARFGVRANHETRSFDLISYDILFDHIIDDLQFIRSSSPYYDGRSFITELQASTQGWVVLNVVEDPTRQLFCDSLQGGIIDFTVQFLEDCYPKLLFVMRGDGTVARETQSPPSTPGYSQHNVAGSLGQNQPSTSTGSYNPPSELSETNLELREVGEKLSRTTMASDREERPAPSIASSSRTTTIENRSVQKRPTQENPTKHKKTTVEYVSDDDDLDDEDTEGTLGTHNMPGRNYLKALAGKTYIRSQAERFRTEEQTVTALCTVVQKFGRTCILFTTKKDVLNVLLYENDCTGVTEPLQLGESAFFKMKPRRTETQDELIPRAPYTHIATEMLETTKERQEKIDEFQSSVRCFGGLVQMKVKILLTEGRGNKVKPHYEEDEQIRTEEERRFYYLKATNGVYVSIPVQRIIELLNADLSADFDLIAWVTHRKAVGNVSLHIGKSGEAYQKMNNGTIKELPPLSTHWMHGRR